MEDEVKLPDSMTLGEARKILRENVDEGLKCMCCSQHVQRYSRPITSAMAAGLIMFYNQMLTQVNHSTWIHVEDFFKAKKIPSSIRGDFSKLRFWGLINVNETEEGFYGITAKGIDFVHDRVKVEANVLIFNNKAYGFRGEYRGIQDCLKKKFDYSALMSGTL